jgi:hypothetical protein
MRAKVITIWDMKPGKGSFVEEIEKMLQRITYWHQASIASYRILYRDADGLSSEIKWDEQHVEVVS